MPNRAFWQSCYETGDTRFDLGGPTPPLLDWLESSGTPPGRAFVPGCGRGYDVIALAQRGFTATGLDFADTPIRDARAAAADAGLLATAQFIHDDLFALGREFDASIDLWWEHTCYCAIPPTRRSEYAALAARVVRPGGLLVFLVFPLPPRDGGPPFAVDPVELASRFGPHFSVLSAEPPRRPSAARRLGKELFAVLRRLPEVPAP